MKKTAKLLAMLITFVMLVSAFAVGTSADLGEYIADYDDYGYYAYFDFQNFSTASSDTANHHTYMRDANAKNANGLLCDPFDFMSNGNGNDKGVGETVTEENGNVYYHFTASGANDNNSIAVFEMEKDGESYIVGDAAEVSFRFRIDPTSADTATANDKLQLVITRRGSAKGNIQHLTADIYGNLYANVNGKNPCIYTNGDGKTPGGDGEFMNIAFRWYDVTNTYSVFLNGEPLVEGIPLRYDYRGSSYVSQSYNDDFGVESKTVIGGSTATSSGDDRTIELIRSDFKDGKKFSFDVDDVKLLRVETAQQGKIYYENSFDGLQDGISSHLTSTSYLYQTTSGITLSAADENGNKHINVASGSWFALNDVGYQQFTQGNTVIQFKIKGTATHTSGQKAFLSIRDSAGENLYKLLWVDPDGTLYAGVGGSQNRIEGYKLDGSEWLDIAIVAIKNTDNLGKFGSFSSATKKSQYNDTYYFGFYINGDYVGASSVDYIRWNGEYSWVSPKTVTASGFVYNIVDYTVGTDGVEALVLDNFTLVDNTTTTDNHEVWKGTDSNGNTVYYDITFDAEGNQTAYSAMTLTAPSSPLEESLRFLTDASFSVAIDDVAIYEGTAPKAAYESANSVNGGDMVTADFANITFPSANINARTHAAGSDVRGIIMTSGITAGRLTRKDANGIVTTDENAGEPSYSTVSFKGGNWFDFFIPMPTKVNGVYDFEYSYETTIKNIGFNAEDSTVQPVLNLFSNRFETTEHANYSAWMMSVDNSFNIYAGAKVAKLYNKDGTVAKIDNNNWNTLRVDAHFYQDSSKTAIEFSYYLNGELLYLEGGTPAYRIVKSGIAPAGLLQRFGNSNYRLRYTQMDSGKSINLDVKSINVRANAKPVYNYVSDGLAKFNDNVTVIELDVPQYMSAQAVGEYDLLSLSKTAAGKESSLPVLSANPMTDKISVGVSGLKYDLCDKNGNAYTLGDKPLAVTVVYDDNGGKARYYVDGKIAYINLSGGLTAAADLGIYSYSFASLKSVSSTSYVLFGGFGTGENAVDTSTYKLNTYNIKDSDNAELIGFQSNSITDGIRVIAGLDTLYYSSVGFEMETFVDGVSKGVKDISNSVVYESIVADDKTITAKSKGYEYLFAGIITNVPNKVTDNTYVEIRAYTEVEGFKHYDDKIQLVITNDGYYFRRDGVLYENDFNGLSALPSEFVKTGSNSAVALDPTGQLDFDSTASTFSTYYLNQYVGSDYLVQADITIDARTAENRYFGLVGRLQSSSKYVEAGVRFNGVGGWIEADGGGGGLKSFVPSDLGLSFELGGTYTLTLICKGDAAAFFVDGVLLGEATIPEGYENGYVGICTSGVSMSVDNFIVRTIDDIYNEVLYDEDFDDLTSLPEGWAYVSSGSNSIGSVDNVTVTEDGKLRVSQPNGVRMDYYLTDDLGTDDYKIEADITIVARETVARYMGLVFRYASKDSFGIAASRFNGAGWIENRMATGWGSVASFNLESSLELNKTYKLSVICRGNDVSFYIDGELIASGTLPEGYETGGVGVSSSGITMDVDNFTVTSIGRIDDSFTLYEENFDDLTEVPAEWDINKAATRNYIISGFTKSVSDGQLVLSSSNSGNAIELKKDFEYTDYVYEADITMVGSDVRAGLMFGLHEDKGKHAYAQIRLGNTSSGMSVFTNSGSGGTYVTIGYGSLVAQPVSGDKHHVKMVMDDGYATLYVDAVEIGTWEVTDTDCLSGRFGIWFRGGTVNVDNVRLYKVIDKYEISEKNSKSTRIRVASWNVGDYSSATSASGAGISLGNGTDTTKEQYTAVMQKVGADLWGLQEDSQYFDGTVKSDNYEALYSNVHPYYERNFTGTYNGKAFLSSYEIYDVVPIYYPTAKTSYSDSATYSHKWFLTGKIKVDGKEISLATLHFDWACKERRAYQIQAVLDYAKKQEYCIILGDFNPENYVNGNVVADPNDADYVNGPDHVNMYQVDWKKFTDAGFTPSNGGRFGAYGTLMKNGVVKNPYPWDCIFVSSNIKILNAEPAYESWMSDHAIVFADLEIN